MTANPRKEGRDHTGLTLSGHSFAALCSLHNA